MKGHPSALWYCVKGCKSVKYVDKTMMGGEITARLRQPMVTPPSSTESFVGTTVSAAADAKRRGTRRTRRTKRSPAGCRCCGTSCTVLTLLAFCCVGTVLVAVVAFVSVVIFFVPEEESVSEEAYVDRGSTLGGKRPVLPSDLRLSQLTTCGVHGGPSPSEEGTAQEMVYWQNIPTDHSYKSPFYDDYESYRRYLTFEPDGGGFNNVRMSVESVIAMAHAMGRTLVLPPSQEVYLLYDTDDDKNKSTTGRSEGQKREFGLADFFPIAEIAASHKGLDIISMEEFLTREGLTGNLRDRQTGQISFPPDNNRTAWDGDTEAITALLQPWLESVAFQPDWNPELCLAAFAVTRDPDDAASLELRWRGTQISGGFPHFRKFVGLPTPVYAGAYDRMAEHMNGRTQMCLYNHTLLHEPLLHFHGKSKWGGRLLVPFYAFLFFEDWRQDVWTKRFVRDNLRYTDEIQCAAARVVAAVRERARQRGPLFNNNNEEGLYDAFHVRRGEFQYKKTRVSAQDMYDISKDKIPEGATVYMATDERNKKFFRDMAAHYDVVYLDDFAHVLDGINTNYYGMIDQLVASRSRTFFGCWFSTFTAYINRLRGYHADRLKAPGFGQGIIDSYYYALPEHKMRMREYWPVSGAVYAREFPTSWRNIDQGIEELSNPKPYYSR